MDAAIDTPVMDAPSDMGSTACPSTCDPFGCETGTTTCRPKKLWLFLSTGQYTGNGFGARAGGDAHCLETYDANFTARSCSRSRVHAVLTIDGADTIGLMPTKFGVPIDVPVHRAADDVIVSDNWNLLTGLNVPRNPPANEASEALGTAWSGASGTATCSAWAAGDTSQSGAQAHATLTVTTWLNRGSVTCEKVARLLCMCWSGGD
jgi:hypothetical protein